MDLKFLILLLPMLVNGHINGAPPEACSDMTPLHGVPAQNSSTVGLYAIEVQPNQDGSHNITLKSISSIPFKGFFLQVRKSGTEEIIGEWSDYETVNASKLVDCGTTGGKWVSELCD